jgi:uncharacterized membrane protein
MGTIQQKPSSRVDSIDFLRGLVMVIMALDHTRDYLRDFGNDPTNLDTTTPALFATRWITHYCAPTFVFLAGAGAFLFGARGRTKREVAWFLLTRGLWLVILDITVIRLGWTFKWNDWHETGGGVIWAIGWSMVLLSGLQFLPTSAVTAIGLFMIGYHNLLDGKTAEQVHLPPWLWTILHQPGEFVIRFREWTIGGRNPGELRLTGDAYGFGTGYCLIPWAGVVMAGYGFGALMQLEQGQRRRQVFALGVVLCLAFFLLRYSNAYGDSRPPQASPNGPGPWSVQEDRATMFIGEEVHVPRLFTAYSFVNCVKYPPSLLYLLMTIGPAMIVLACFDRPLGALAKPFVVFGRVPFFFYLIHIPLINALAVAYEYRRFGKSYLMETGLGLWKMDPTQLPEGYNVDLRWVYLAWIGVVVVLYLPCLWWGALKRRYPGGVLSYL